MGHEYVKENDVFSTDQNGVVPKPTDSDIENNHVLKADHTWGEGGGSGEVVDVKVNGDSVLDENKEAQITSYKEVTMSEYNALPQSKETDGVLYCIKDAGGADAFPPLIFSDEEREIGVWRDGRPLYQKTIDCGYLPNNDTSLVQTGLTNIVAIQAFGYCLSSFQNIFISNVSAAGVQWCIGIHLEDNGATLKVRTGADRSLFYAYVTLRYYKTTDTPGSGIWNQQGSYAHHYSTTEHIIGTWTDGKPLYERCFYVNTYPNQLASNWLQQYNVKSIKFGYIHPWDGQVEQISYDFTFHTTNKTWTSSCAKWTDFIYLQYTKTTD